MVDSGLWDEWGVKYGLDKPVVVQYFVFLGKIARGDLDRSFREQRPVIDLIVEKVPNTLQLGLAAFILSNLIAIPLGVLSAVKRGSVWDYAGRSLAVLGQSMPPFWLGLMLILLFSVELGWLPTSRKGGIDHFVLPVITLGSLSLAGNLRLVRSSMLEVLDTEYVKMARAKGVAGWKVIWKHALRNALITPITHAGILFVGLITGSVVTETVFAWPGLGRLATNAVIEQDYPVVSGTILVFTLAYVILALLIDVVYALVDPRVKAGAVR
jgi:peptide/nickel transport system permease protein